MDLTAALFTVALVVPLVAFALSIVYRGMYANTVAHALLVLGGLVGLTASAFYFVGGMQGLEIAPIFHMNLAVRGVSAFFLVLIYLGTVLTSIFALDYVQRYADTYTPHWLNAATALFIFGMQAVVLSMTVVGFLLSWEIMSLAAYLLVIADRKNESMRAGFLYLLMTHIGFLAIAAGFLILSDGDPWATWGDLTVSARTLPGAYLTTAFFLLFAGFGSKAGLVPLHQWLPLAHPQAPSHSSALLSGVMLKVALFGFLRSLLLFPVLPAWWGLVIIAVGLLSALFGVIHAAIESDMKKMLAWSSIENMGLIFSAVGALIAVSTLPATPAVAILTSAAILFISLHSLNHFLFKTGLFMTAGAIGAMAHTRDLDELGGLAQKWPLFSGAAMLLALGAAALPPLGTFFGEWLYVQSLANAIGNVPLAFSIAAALMLATIGLVAGVAIFTFANFFSSAFLGRARTQAAEHAGTMPRLLVVPPALCAAGLLAVGPFIPFLRGLPLGQQDLILLPQAGLNPLLMLFLFAIVALVLFMIAKVLKRSVRITDTWDCGQPLTPRMQYTATGFSAPIRFFFRAIVLSHKRMIVAPIAPGNPWIAKRTLEWETGSFWEKWLYVPIGKAVLRGATLAKRLQSGVVQVYLLLLVIALVVTMLFAL